MLPLRKFIHHRTPFWYACSRGQLRVAQWLLDLGVNDIHTPDNYNRTPLWIACARGHLAMAKWLVSNGAIHTLDRNSQSPFSVACQRGHFLTAKWLFDQFDININDQDMYARERDNATALWYAAKSGTPETAEWLIAQGANLNIRDYHGISPIHAACRENHPVAEVLLAHGCALGFTDIMGQTELDAACSSGNLALVQKLVKLGSSPLRTIAACRGGHLPIVEWLVSQGVPLQPDSYKRTPIWHASITGHVEMVEWLSSRGESINAADKDKQTPLFAAVQTQRYDTVKWLLDRDAVKTGDIYGRSPMNVACTVGDLRIAQLLHQAGCPIHEEVTFPPIMVACAHDHFHVGKWLYSLGELPDLKRLTLDRKISQVLWFIAEGVPLESPCEALLRKIETCRQEFMTFRRIKWPFDPYLAATIADFAGIFHGKRLHRLTAYV